MILLIKIGIVVCAVTLFVILYWLMTTSVERELDEEETELFGD